MYSNENNSLFGNRPSTAQRKQQKRAELQADMNAHLAAKQQQQLPRRSSNSQYHVQPIQQSTTYDEPHTSRYTPQYGIPTQYNNDNNQSQLNTSQYNTQLQYNDSYHNQSHTSRPPSGIYNNSNNNQSNGTGLQLPRPSTADIKRQKQAQYKEELMEQMNHNAINKFSSLSRNTPIQAPRAIQSHTPQQQQYSYQPPIQQQLPVQSMQSYSTYTAPVNLVQPIVHRVDAGSLSMFNNRPSTAQRKQAMKEQQKQDMAEAQAAKQALNRAATGNAQPPAIQQYNHPPISSQPPRQPTPLLQPQNYVNAAQLAREHAASLMMSQPPQQSPTSQFHYPTLDASIQSQPPYITQYDTQSLHQPQSPVNQQLSPSYSQRQLHTQYNEPYSTLQPPIQQYNDLNNTYTSQQSLPYTQYSQLSPTNQSNIQSTVQPNISHYTLPRSPSNKGLSSNLLSMHNGHNPSEQQIKAEKQRIYQAELAEQVRMKELVRKLEQAKLDEIESKKEREIQQCQPIVKGGRKRYDQSNIMTNNTSNATQYNNNMNQSQYNDVNTTYNNQVDQSTYDDITTPPSLNATVQSDTTATKHHRKFMSGLGGLRAGLTDEQQAKKDIQKLELQQALQQQIQSKAQLKRAEAEKYKAEQAAELHAIEQYNQQQNKSSTANNNNNKSSLGGGGGLQHSPVQSSRSSTANQQYKLDLQQQIAENKQIAADEKLNQSQLDEQYDRKQLVSRPHSSHTNKSAIDVQTSVSDLSSIAPISTSSQHHQPSYHRIVSQQQLEQQYAELQQHQQNTVKSTDNEIAHNSLLLELKKHADNTTHQLELITAKLNATTIQQTVYQPPVQPVYQPAPNVPLLAQLPDLNVYESCEPLQYTSRLLPIDTPSRHQLPRSTLSTRDTHRPMTNSFKRNAAIQLHQTNTIDEMPRLQTASVSHIPYHNETRLNTSINNKPIPSNRPSSGLLSHQPTQTLQLQTRPTTSDELYNDGNNTNTYQHTRKTSVHVPLNLAAFGVTHATINPTDMITQRDTMQHQSPIKQPIRSESPKHMINKQHDDGRKFSILGASAAISPPITNKHVNNKPSDHDEYPPDDEFAPVDASQTFQVMSALDAY